MQDLVVGDIVVLEAGDRVPADCWLCEEMDILVDEKEYFPNAANFSEKQCSLNSD